MAALEEKETSDGPMKTNACDVWPHSANNCLSPIIALLCKEVPW